MATTGITKLFIHLHVVAAVRDGEAELAIADPKSDMPVRKGPSTKTRGLGYLNLNVEVDP